MKPSWRYSSLTCFLGAEGWRAVLAPERDGFPHPLPVLGAGAHHSTPAGTPVPPPCAVLPLSSVPGALPAGGTLPLSPASTAPVLGGPPDSDKCPRRGVPVFIPSTPPVLLRLLSNEPTLDSGSTSPSWRTACSQLQKKKSGIKG